MIPKYLNPKALFRRFFIYKDTLDKLNGIIIYYNISEDRNNIFNKIKHIAKESELLLQPDEAYQLFSIVERLTKIPGDMAEVGTFKGGSAKIILEADSSHKPLHLFDTFEGLPKPTSQDFPEHFFQGGEYKSSMEEVKHYLRNYPQAHFYKGTFPKTAEALKDLRFSFVNIDVDLHQCTHDALEFFYPRMNKGGVIISHDYIKAGGVRRAVDDFFKDKPEAVFETAGTQCFIVKI